MPTSCLRKGKFDIFVNARKGTIIIYILRHLCAMCPICPRRVPVDIMPIDILIYLGVEHFTRYPLQFFSGVIQICAKKIKAIVKFLFLFFS